MLEEKLEKARVRSANQIKLVVISLLSVLGLCAIVVIALSYFDFSAKEPVVVVPPEQPPPSATDTKTDTTTDQVAATTTDTASENIRAEFKELLQQYDNELEPRLRTIDFANWNPDAYSEIDGLKQQAMLSFSQTAYQEALEKLQLLKGQAVETIDKADTVFNDSIEKAASSFTKDLYDEAKLNIDKALMVASQSPEALDLQYKIEKLSELLPFLKQISIARAENDLHKEHDLLQQVAQLTPERKEIAERLKIVEKLIQNQNFETQIAAGFAAVAQKEVKKARQHYQEAKKVDPKRDELSVLAGQLLALEKSIRTQKSIKLADQAVRRDDWVQAQNYFGKAAKEAPDNKIVFEGLRKANLVIDLQTQLNQYISNPYRLSDKNISHEAEQTLMQAKPVSAYSFSIKRQADQLSELLAALNRPLPITINSDNKTFVFVRGVGKVGTVSQKQIELKPGNYTFEGRRDGFKSKLVRVLVPYDQQNFSISVICDEPI